MPSNRMVQAVPMPRPPAWCANDQRRRAPGRRRTATARDSRPAVCQRRWPRLGRAATAEATKPAATGAGGGRAAGLARRRAHASAAVVTPLSRSRRAPRRASKRESPPTDGSRRAHGRAAGVVGCFRRGRRRHRRCRHPMRRTRADASSAAHARMSRTRAALTNRFEGNCSGVVEAYVDDIDCDDVLRSPPALPAFGSSRSQRRSHAGRRAERRTDAIRTGHRGRCSARSSRTTRSGARCGRLPRLASTAGTCLAVHRGGNYIKEAEKVRDRAHLGETV